MKMKRIKPEMVNMYESVGTLAKGFEGVYRQLRKTTKTKDAFVSDLLLL